MRPRMKSQSTGQELRDPRTRVYVQPTRMIWQSPGCPVPPIEDFLLKPGSGQATVWAGPGWILKNEGMPPGFCVDFGKELQGGIQIICGDMPEHQPVKLRVRFGESVSEAMGQPNNDHAIHDCIVHVPWMGVTEIGNTGFRFVRVDLVEEGSFLEIKELRAVSLFRDLEWKGSFTCNDQLLNEIWHTGAYTVHLNMQDYVWDGIKRDRLVWMGDLHPEIRVISTVFGDVDAVRDSLDLVRDETPLPGWMNGMSTYSLWWIVCQRDWFLYNGNSSYLKQQRPYLLSLLQQVMDHVDERGEERLPGGFLDWPTSKDPEEVHAGVQALLKISLEAGGALCRALGDEKEARQCHVAAGKLRSLRGGRTKQVNALRVLSGLADPQETNARVLSRDPFEGISTFYGFYVLEARALAGDHKGTLDLIRAYWGGMLHLGATTFWEDFDLAWMENASRIDEMPREDTVDVHATYGDYCYKGLRHSLCHGWAGGPTAWLSEHVLGVRPSQAGFKEVRIAPHLGDLEWVEGTFPTPYGMISVRHNAKRDGTVCSDIQLPDGVRSV